MSKNANTSNAAANRPFLEDAATEPPPNADNITTTAGPVEGPETPTAAEPTPLSAEQIEKLKANAAKAEEYWDRLLRAAAELENYKKRAVRERQDAVKYANELLLEKLVPVLDHFDMALTAANSPQSSSVESIRTGISMIYNQLKTLLTEAGLEEIDATNKPFDANWHEAVSQQESAEAPEGQVLQQLRKGYKLRDRLIRPAAVVVAKKPMA